MMFSTEKRGPFSGLGLWSALHVPTRTQGIPTFVGAMAPLGAAVSALSGLPMGKSLAVASQVLRAEGRLRGLAEKCRNGRGPSSFLAPAGRVPDGPLLE